MYRFLENNNSKKKYTLFIVAVTYFSKAISMNLCSNRTCCAETTSMAHHFPPSHVRIRFLVLETRE